jgi:Cu-processing system permease protein
MGSLVASQGQMGVNVFAGLLLLNPADVYRLFNLTAFENVRMLSGMAGLSSTVRFSPLILLVVLAAWSAIPLAIAIGVFKRREA